jgi:NADPH:quinone reductase-like Zn-dependent oxidoreductase
MGSLQLIEEAMPQLTSSDQVLVEVQALGLNLADVFCCLGEDLARPAVTQRCCTTLLARTVTFPAG